MHHVRKKSDEQKRLRKRSDGEVLVAKRRRNSAHDRLEPLVGAKEHPKEEELEVTRRILIASLDDFPPETQEKFEDFEVTRDVLEHNLDVCTHVLSFVEKKPYVTAEYYAWYLKRKSLYNSEEEDSESGATTEEKSEGEASTAETAPDDSASDTADATPPSASASDCAAKAKKGIDESYFKPLDELLSPENPKKMFKFIQKEGKGGFGRVYFAKHRRSGDLIAIKKVDASTEKQDEACRREIFFLELCRAPTIVDYRGAYRVDNEIWIAMEYLEGCDIDRACQTFNFKEEHIAFVAFSVCSGLRYLHQRNLVHRDLKGANIMLTTYGEVFIIDLGLMVNVEKEHAIHRCGTRSWMAPEMIRREEQTAAVDIWSMAVCLVQMANGHRPRDNDLKHMFRIATSGFGPSLGLDIPEKWSGEFRDFLDRALAHDPKNRASAAQLLEHPFIKKNLTATSSESIANVVSYCEVKKQSGYNGMF